VNSSQRLLATPKFWDGGCSRLQGASSAAPDYGAPLRSLVLAGTTLGQRRPIGRRQVRSFLVQSAATDRPANSQVRCSLQA
jgi:hypothetical protein